MLFFLFERKMRPENSVDQPKQAGISNLVVTMALIAATIAGGLYLYAVMRGQTQVRESVTNVRVNSAGIVKAQGQVTTSVTVSNAGTKPLDNVVVEVRGEGGSAHTLLDYAGFLEPGRSASSFKQFPADNFVMGEQYILHVSATASDGSTVDKTLNVEVE
ncbi:hypothetical protein AKJ62_03925 [candidate division MSBL1 archaeon SCGC-AAA259D14]|uniref:CARDB domain-containing protein n=1 Tax=candidate division MSBL1 archaeon SCGC-AAA259D14 TaxID=1698261 RepID=A0A133U4C1_9EURY|nr:hypothetical protein AKJ62_03925 [candidate division MSBL1 archaeon SCGC-AAA259D14]